MGPYKLLALDMDGTLLRSDKTISPATWQALEELAGRGVEVTLSTGRCTAEVAYTFHDGMGPIRYGSLESGALAYDFEAREALAFTPVPDDLALKLIEIGALEDAMLHLHCLGGSVILAKDLARMDAFGMGVYQELFEAICTTVDDLGAYVRAHPGEVSKVNLYHLTPESRERTRQRIAGMPLQLADAEETSLECSAAGVSKDKGLEAVCQKIGITMDEVVAVGDAANDLQALRAAGCAVAMGNATADVKAEADLVVADCDHDGIIEAIDRLF